jgi:hypothetical protein
MCSPFNIAILEVDVAPVLENERSDETLFVTANDHFRISQIKQDTILYFSTIAEDLVLLLVYNASSTFPIQYYLDNESCHLTYFHCYHFKHSIKYHLNNHHHIIPFVCFYVYPNNIFFISLRGIAFVLLLSSAWNPFTVYSHGTNIIFPLESKINSAESAFELYQ